RVRSKWVGFLLLSSVVVGGLASPTLADAGAPEGWTTRAPRDEIRPAFEYRSDGGPRNEGSLVIEADARDGLFGWWEKSLPIQGGTYYRFSAIRKTDRVQLPRRTVVERILWRDEKNQPIEHEEQSRASFQEGKRPRSEPEYPVAQGV